MRVTREIDTAWDVRDMVWSGAKDRVKFLTDDEIETILDILDEGEPWTETQLNDFFWFEDDTIAEWLGFSNFDEIMEREV